MKSPHAARRATAALAVAVALAMPGIPAARAAIHDFDAAECAACHPRYPAEAPGALRVLAGRIHAQCVKCHNPCDPGASHGADRHAPALNAERLPLDETGAMDCRTCHFVHVAPAETPADPELLRIANIRRELCLACHQEQSPGRLTVVSPPEGVTVRGPEMLLAGTVEVQPREDLFVRLDGTPYPLPVRAGAFSTWISLDEGVNRIEILAGEAVLWETEVLRPAADAPGATAYRRLHQGHLTGRGECADCHGDTGAGYARAASPTASALCYRCHDRFEGKRYLHGPVAVGACLSCHDPHGGLTEAALVEEPPSLCLSCHARGDVRHCVTGPASGSPGCTACHDPHQSDARYFRKGEEPRPGAPAR